MCSGRRIAIENHRRTQNHSSRCNKDKTNEDIVKNNIPTRLDNESNTLRALLRKLTLETKLHARRRLLRVGEEEKSLGADLARRGRKNHRRNHEENHGGGSATFATARARLAKSWGGRNRPSQIPGARVICA